MTYCKTNNGFYIYVKNVELLPTSDLINKLCEDGQFNIQDGVFGVLPSNDAYEWSWRTNRWISIGNITVTKETASNIVEKDTLTKSNILVEPDVAEQIQVSKYIYYDCNYGRFYLTTAAQEILYNNKQLICSYSGCNDWIDHFVHEMMNLYTGNSPYNYALGTCNYHIKFPRLWKDHPNEINAYVQKSLETTWGKAMYDCIDHIIDEVPSHK